MSSNSNTGGNYPNGQPLWSGAHSALAVCLFVGILLVIILIVLGVREIMRQLANRWHMQQRQAEIAANIKGGQFQLDPFTNEPPPIVRHSQRTGAAKRTRRYRSAYSFLIGVGHPAKLY